MLYGVKLNREEYLYMAKKKGLVFLYFIWSKNLKLKYLQALAWRTGARAVTRANQEKGGLGERWKARPKVKLRGLISPAPNSK